MICDLLGIPPESRADFRTWVGPLLIGGIAGFEAYAAARKMITFLRELVAEKRRNPADDLLSALLEARDGEDRLSEDEREGLQHSAHTVRAVLDKLGL